MGIRNSKPQYSSNYHNQAHNNNLTTTNNKKKRKLNKLQAAFYIQKLLGVIIGVCRWYVKHGFELIGGGDWGWGCF